MADEKHIGKNCPYCITQIQPDDEIKLCPECEQPHHMDCWLENEGCTTYGCVCGPAIRAHQTVGSYSDRETRGSITDSYRDPYYYYMPSRYSDSTGRISGWNWGACLLAPAWLIMMKREIWALILIFLVAAIPFLEFRLFVLVGSSIILGAIGNNIAWKSREWRDINHFRRTQDAWRNWAFHVWIIGGFIAYRIYLIIMRNL